jgi:cytidine deaminase
MDSRLLDAARHAMARAHAPYSKYKVGAAILGDDGAIYAGCNVENAAYPEGTCAETSAIGAMVLGGAAKIREIVIIGTGAAPTMPCGGCRQRMVEFATPETSVHVCAPDGVRHTFRLRELLPQSFGKKQLE